MPVLATVYFTERGRRSIGDISAEDLEERTETMEEREKTIDRFDLVRTYQNAESKEDFLYMLLNLEAVQAQSSMVSYIREVLHCMKQYARQHTLAVIKGIISSVFPGKKENSGEVYERWEDTP